MSAYLTPSDIAIQLGVSRAHVSRLIQSGSLRATNVARPTAKRPTYRIDADALAAFMAAGSSNRQRAGPSESSRKRRSPSQAKRFF
ncbi:Helix-turn-helix domain protein [Posidoniimonas polymericola]|uniref:Helix-turn-helix domain protein n=1 Tax=Posidoniimonas polymericola TaxID=2528002 RepID=A0A5C5XVK1_9BACT|nr:excisionase family DNA-binding protein [Posidoniimonas polymericola]TWT66920.1 Helix-turn-helix domain protein [Posidoniimonas polymericola]